MARRIPKAEHTRKYLTRQAEARAGSETVSLVCTAVPDSSAEPVRLLELRIGAGIRQGNLVVKRTGKASCLGVPTKDTSPLTQGGDIHVIDPSVTREMGPANVLLISASTFFQVSSPTWQSFVLPPGHYRVWFVTPESD